MKVLILGSGYVGTALHESMMLEKIEVDVISLRNAVFSNIQIQNDIDEATHIVWAGRDIATIRQPGMDNSVFFDELLSYLSTRRHFLHFSYISSGGAIYGNADLFPTNEIQDINPISSYGRGKKMGEERLVRISAQNRNIQLSILRASNLYNLNQNQNNFIATALRSLHNKNKLIIHGGNQTRDFLHVSDFAKIAIALYSQGLTGIFNVGTGKSYSLFKVLDILKEISTIEIECEIHPMSSEDVLRSELDVCKMKNIYGEELLDLSTLLLTEISSEK